LHEQQRIFILGLFNENLKSFADFHTRLDETDYLEIQEDIDKQREETAQQLLDCFCLKWGVTKAQQIQRNPGLFTEISARLTIGAKLSLRQAAAMLETTHRRVHQALQDND